MAYCANDTADNYIRLLPKEGSQRCVCLAQSRSMLGAVFCTAVISIGFRLVLVTLGALLFPLQETPTCLRRTQLMHSNLLVAFYWTSAVHRATQSHCECIIRQGTCFWVGTAEVPLFLLARNLPTSLTSLATGTLLSFLSLSMAAAIASGGTWRCVARNSISLRIPLNSWKRWRMCFLQSGSAFCISSKDGVLLEASPCVAVLYSCSML